MADDKLDRRAFLGSSAGATVGMLAGSESVAFAEETRSSRSAQQEADLREAPEGTRGPYWWEIPTLFGCKIERDPSAADIALVGVPHSTGNGTTDREQHLGPRAIRDVSMGYRRFHLRDRELPWRVCRIRDFGDAYMPNMMNNDKTMEDIEAFLKPLDEAGTRTVAVGGDHSVTMPMVRAFTGPDSKVSGQPVAMVHLDAHRDTYSEGQLFYGNRYWAGSWGRDMNLEGLVDPDKVFQIGLRGDTGPISETYSGRAGYRVIMMEEFEERGAAAVAEEIRERVGDTPLYITIDLDVLDTTLAPAVSNPEFGYRGFTMAETRGLLQGMWGLNVVGGDVCEIIPTKDDAAKSTAINASVVTFELICLVAQALRS